MVQQIRFRLKSAEKGCAMFEGNPGISYYNPLGVVQAIGEVINVAQAQRIAGPPGRLPGENSRACHHELSDFSRLIV